MDRLVKNQSPGDRIMRTVLGVIFLLIGVSASISPGWSTIFLLLSAYSLITAALAYDPIYTLFQFSTNPEKITGRDQNE